MAKMARVALLIETSSSWGSGLILGISHYAQAQCDWMLCLEPRGKYEPLCLPVDRKYDGIIARVTAQQLAEQILESNLPAINVSWYTYGRGQIPRCTTDVKEAGRLCADHFFNRGFRSFAYCGSHKRPNYVDELAQSFVETLRSIGHDCDCYEDCGAEGSVSWQEDLNRLGSWLAGLQKPVGLLAFDAIRGRQITEICKSADIRIPDDVAVLAGEHDKLFCEVSRPPLSSLDISPQRVGFEAAALLDRLMKGESITSDRVAVAPGRILQRQSTNTLAIDDAALAAAIRFIREHAHEPFHVKDVLKSVPLSRRMLEQQFRVVLGRTPAAEIRRVRIQRAKRLLEDTDLSMPAIASRCGLERAEVFTRVFRREAGMTPSTYRKQAKRD